MFDQLQRSTKPSVSGSIENKEVSKRKSDQIRRLENKLSELGQIIREKNAKIDEANKQLEKLKQDHQQEVSKLYHEFVKLQNFPDSHKVTDSSTKNPENSKNSPNGIVRHQQQNGNFQYETVDELRQAYENLTHVLCEREAYILALNSEKNELQTKINSLIVQLNSVIEERDKYASEAAHKNSRLTETCEEIKALQLVLDRKDADFQLRERSLLERIRQLENGPSISPSSSPGFTPVPVEESDSVDLSPTRHSPHQTTDNISLSATSSNADLFATAAGDVKPTTEQLNHLLQERDTLISRLQSMRDHLAEAKAQWNGCVASLELQVEQLNSKLEENAVEYQRKELAYQATITDLELKLRANVISESSELASNRRRTLEHSRGFPLELKVKSADNEALISEVNFSHSCAARFPDLSEEVKNYLSNMVAQKDQIIKLQQKRMKEMKRALAGHIRSKPVPSDQDSVEGLVTGWHPFSTTAEPRTQSLERLSVGSTHSCPSVPVSAYPPPGEESFKRVNPNTSMGSVNNRMPSTSPVRPTSNTNMVPVELVNFRYLRHVIMKFLLSGENEAAQLIRALSALLYLTAEEEKLLRQSLHNRRSWLRGKPTISPSKSRGQFAKIIPPSS